MPINNMSLEALKARLCARAAVQSETTKYETALIGILSKEPYCECATVKGLLEVLERERDIILKVDMKKVERLETIEMVDENRRLYKEAHNRLMYILICEEIFNK